MKPKSAFTKILRLLLCLLFYSFNQVNAQAPGYTCRILNINQPSGTNNQLEFEIWLKATGPVQLSLTYIQMGIDVNAAIRNGGTMTAALVPGFSQMAAAQSTPSTTYTASTSQFRVAAATAPVSTCTNINPGDSVRIARWRFTNSVPFLANSTPNFTWSFITAANKTKTDVAAYFDGATVGAIVTSPLSHFVVGNPALNVPLCSTPVIGSTITHQSCSNVNDGAIDITPSGGGTASYTYAWSNGATTEDLSGLAPGPYTVTVTTNTGGCSATAILTVNAGPAAIQYYTDLDADTYGTTSLGLSCTVPSNSATRDGDCNDNNAAIHPGATEICNGIDDDCDSNIDDGLVFNNYFTDTDGDTYGAGAPLSACQNPGPGFVLTGGDCDDTRSFVYPGAPELCNSIDDDCDGSMDDGITFNNYYSDADNDNFGSTLLGSFCTPPLNSATVPGDCNDNDATIYPGATELCNNADDDCDGVNDDGLTLTAYYTDLDHDFYGTTLIGSFCAPPPGAPATVSGDCDDNNAAVHPGATELCNNIDDDCVNGADDGLTFVTYYSDLDNDTYGGTVLGSFCSPPSTGSFATTGGDCDDNNAAIHPGATELCNNVDDDCDLSVDEGISSQIYYADNDLDTYGGAVLGSFCAPPATGPSSTTGGDCDDADAAVHPGATETCNNKDDDCDGSIDEGLSLQTYYTDNDLDTYGTGSGQSLCQNPGAGFSTIAGDCDDNNAAVNPAAQEICNGGIDDDCDTFADDADPSTTGKPSWYADADLDGYGTGAPAVACFAPAGYVSQDGDCDDLNAAVHPGAVEVCSAGSIDEDCDGLADDQDPSTLASSKTTFYPDDDGDSYGAGAGVLACLASPPNTATTGGDCDDTNAAIHPGATELCNGVDDDCVSGIDNGLTFTTYYTDADGDGFGTGSGSSQCSNPGGMSTVAGDCNDADNTIFPGAVEQCNNVDDNCDGAIDNGITFVTYYTDADNDGYGTGSGTSSCTNPGAGFSSLTGDCNDALAFVNPGATEICNSIDDDCDGSIDEGVISTFYPDNDNDGFGAGTGVMGCTAPPNHVSNNTDCNDNNAAVHALITYYRDLDVDGFGNPAVTVTVCSATAPAGYVSNDSDCDDTKKLYVDTDNDGFGAGPMAPCGVASNTDCNNNNASIKPGGIELCNGVDDNCNSIIDDGVIFRNYFSDLDGDTYGKASIGVFCSPPSPTAVLVGGDCNDNNPAIHPNATELCNGIDDDCDLTVDDGLSFVMYYVDVDGDGSGRPGGTLYCSNPGGNFVTQNGDCNDTDPAIHPLAQEICNGGIDDDCDGNADDFDITTLFSTKTAWYVDSDADSYGSSSASPYYSCVAPAGFVASNTDCDDGNAGINPGVAEICNLVDDNCDGNIDEGVQSSFYVDNDNDGFGFGTAILACTAPPGTVSNNSDCDDTKLLYADNDGDGIGFGLPVACGQPTNTDCNDNDPTVTAPVTYYRDFDGDSFGNPSETTLVCLSVPPAGYVSNNLDCDDLNFTFADNDGDGTGAGAPVPCGVLSNTDCNDNDNSVTHPITYYRDADGDLYGTVLVTTSVCSSVPPTGFVVNSADCDDAHFTYNDSDGDGVGAGAPTPCGVFTNTDCNDFDITVSSPQTYYADVDGDNFGNVLSPALVCLSSPPPGFVSNSLDCDDLHLTYTDADGDGVGAGAPVPCGVLSGSDCNDSDPTVSTPQTYYLDADGDSFGKLSSTTVVCSSFPPAGYVSNALDCDDANFTYTDSDGDGVGAGAPVPCGVLSNTDCNDNDPTVFAPITYYVDGDGDTFGWLPFDGAFCQSSPPAGYVSNSLDCDDTHFTYTDNDGDGVGAGVPVPCGVLSNTDCNDNDLSVSSPQTYYRDQDGDSFGDLATTTSVCSSVPPSGFVSNNLDCDDLHFTFADNDGDGVGAGAPVPCGVLSNTDCNDNDNSVTAPVTYYADFDIDGFGNPAAPNAVCSSVPPAGFVSNSLDCDDFHLTYADNDGDAVGAGVPVPCGVLSNTDCNDNDPTVAFPITYYRDFDTDTFGDPVMTTAVCSSVPPAGYVSNSLDCDDTHFTYTDNDNDGVGAGAPVPCGVLSNTDCNDNDFTVSAPVTYYRDFDTDTYGDPAVTTAVCSSIPPVGYVSNQLDCDDLHLTYTDNDGDGVGAGLPVPCGVLTGNDCNDNDITVSSPQTYFRDQDGDTFGDAAVTTSVCSSTAPAGFVNNSLDCDDTHFTFADNDNDGVGAGAPVPCGVLSSSDCNDNDNTVSAPQTYFADQDGDTFGNPSSFTSVCSSLPPAGFVSNSLDCDDNHFTYTDNDGDGVGAGSPVPCGVLSNTDCNDNDLSVTAPVTYYRDADLDTYGTLLTTTVVCSSVPPPGFVSNSLDCDDLNVTYVDNDNDGYGSTIPAPCGSLSNTDCNDNMASVHPGAAELCNLIDEDCDGSVDEGVQSTFYADADNDGYGSMSSTVLACSAPAGFVSNNLDCNDAESSIHPFASETCNNVDEDCDGLVDEGLPQFTYYTDDDADAYGNPSAPFSSCFTSAPAGYSSNAGDCNDANVAIHPGVTELCNTVDDNCNGVIDEGCFCINPPTANAGVNQSVCSGQNVSLTGAIGGAAGTALWTSSGSGLFGDDQAVITTYYPSSADYNNGSVTLTLTTDDPDGSGPCVPGTSSMTVTFNPLPPSAGLINGPEFLCYPQTPVTYSINPIPGVSVYNWTVPAGTVIVSGQGTTALVVSWPFSAIHAGVRGQICVTPQSSNSCGSALPSCLDISVQLTIPVSPNSISGPAKACNGDVGIYSVAPVARADYYVWSLPAGATINPATSSTNIVEITYGPTFAGGILSVRAGNACGIGPERTRTVSLNLVSAPTAINGFTSGLCGVTGVTYSISPVPGASSYYWTVPAGATIVGPSDGLSIQVDFSSGFTTGNLTCSGVNACGLGLSRSVALKGTPATPVFVSAPLVVCAGGNAVYEVQAVAGATSYVWTIPTSATILSGLGTKSITVKFGTTVTSGLTVSVRATNSCGTSSTKTQTGIAVVACPRVANTGIRTFTAYPNPADEILNLSFVSDQGDHANLRLIDLTGRVVINEERTVSEGENTMQVRVKGLASGIYTLQLSMNNRVEQLRIYVE